MRRWCSQVVQTESRISETLYRYCKEPNGNLEDGDHERRWPTCCLAVSPDVTTPRWRLLRYDFGDENHIQSE